MHPIEYTPWASKIGVHVVPAFSVFQTPPDPTATYHVARRFGCMTMSLMRPDMRAGPMLRNSRPDSSSAVMREAGALVFAGG